MQALQLQRHLLSWSWLCYGAFVCLSSLLQHIEVTDHLHDLMDLAVHFLPDPEALNSITSKNCQQCSSTTGSSKGPPACCLE